MAHSNKQSAKHSLSFLIREPLYWLLLALPVAVVLRLTMPTSLWLFVISCIAVIPLAGLMGRATENLAGTMGQGAGGLLNATFGNAAELIIALMALSKGPSMYPLVKASLTGSIIGNILLVLGLAITLGGMRQKRQTFNSVAAGMGATLMALAAAGLIVPSLYRFAVQEHTLVESAVVMISEEIAAVLAFAYLLSLIFSLRTHQHLFAGDDAAEQHEVEWKRPFALTVLLLATAGVAVMSEFLVGSIEHACHELGMNTVFVGVIVVAIVGNAAEHSTAVLVAMKNKMDLAVNIAVGSGIQIALFVAPVLVFASILMGHEHPLDLNFSMLEVLAVILSVVVLAMVCQDGESHWMEGVLLLALYVILAFAFYHLPEAAPGAPSSAAHP